MKQLFYKAFTGSSSCKELCDFVNNNSIEIVSINEIVMYNTEQTILYYWYEV